MAPVWPLLLGVFGGALAAFYWGTTGVYYFPQVRPTMTAGFGAPALQASARQQQVITRGLSRVTRRLHLSPEGSFEGYLVRYHLVRLVRDGSVFFVFFFLLFFLVLGSQTASGSAPPAALSGVLGFPALLSMAILGMNWLAAERENTWVLLTSPRGTGAYFRALLATLLVVGGLLTGLAALLLAAIGLGFQLLALLAALTGVTAGTTTLVLLLERWRIPAASFSLRIPLLFLFPAIAFALGFLPITVLESAPVVVGGFAVPPALLAVGVLLALLGGGLRLVRASSRRFSLEIPTP